MSVPQKHRDRSKAALQPRIKFWLEIAGERVFCPGVCQILLAIDETGSIKRAAARVGRSYRFVWGRLKQAEQVFGEPLVTTRVGGQGDRRSHVTPAGKEFMEAFLTLRQRIFELVDAEFAMRFSQTRKRRSAFGKTPAETRSPRSSRT